MNNTATNTATCPTVRKQIGKTTYIVRVHFSQTAQAQMLILELLADGKRMPSAELEKTVNERGISSRTMRTAKSRIGERLVTEKDGTAWVCYLRN